MPINISKFRYNKSHWKVWNECTLINCELWMIIRDSIYDIKMVGTGMFAFSKLNLLVFFFWGTSEKIIITSKSNCYLIFLILSHH